MPKNKYFKQYVPLYIVSNVDKVYIRENETMRTLVLLSYQSYSSLKELVLIKKLNCVIMCRLLI